MKADTKGFPRPGLNTVFAIVLVALLGCLGWALYLPSLYMCGTAIIMWSLAGAVFGRACSKSPIFIGGIGGLTAVAAFVAAFFAMHLMGYFFHEGPSPYFEDGFVSEIFVYPVVYLIVYGTTGLAIGAMVGASVRGFGWAWKKCRV